MLYITNQHLPTKGERDNNIMNNLLKNKKLLTVAMLAGLTFGGLSAVSVASAQSNGGDNTTESTEEAETGSIVEVQDGGETEDGEPVDGDNDGRRGHRGGCNLETAAEAIGIGIEAADLEAALESGDTIADVAEANGVAVDDVIDAMVDAKADRIAEKVEAGRITQDEADEKLANAEAKISNRVNGVEDIQEA